MTFLGYLAELGQRAFKLGDYGPTTITDWGGRVERVHQIELGLRGYAAGTPIAELPDGFRDVARSLANAQTSASDLSGAMSGDPDVYLSEAYEAAGELGICLDRRAIGRAMTDARIFGLGTALGHIEREMESGGDETSIRQVFDLYTGPGSRCSNEIAA